MQPTQIKRAVTCVRARAISKVTYVILYRTFFVLLFLDIWHISEYFFVVRVFLPMILQRVRNT
jgi:hypothetical protein